MNKRRTHEEYVEELREKNPDLEVIGKYVDTKTAILHHCKKHNVDWYMLPSNALKGQGCKECKREKCGAGKALSNDEYVKRVSEIFPHIKVLEPYITNKKRILHKCTIHDVEWMTSPGSVLQGCSCPECAAEKRKASSTLSNEEYIARVKNISPHIIPLEPYKAMVTPIFHMCTKHNIKWLTTPASILQGCGCRQCKAEKIREKQGKTTEEYNKELESVNPNITCIGEYSGSIGHVLHKCKVCGYEWLAMPTNTLKGSGCPKCNGGYTRTREEFVKELEECNPEIELIGDYINMRTKTLFRCKKHDTYWNALPNNILKGIGCKECGKEKIAMKNTLTHDEYVRRVKEISPNIEVLGQYIGNKKSIMHMCTTHNVKWMTTPGSILQGCGCAKCRSEKLRDGRFIPFEGYENRLMTANSNIICIGEYDGISKPALHKCRICGYEWRTTPASVLSGTGCPKCNGRYIRTKEEFLKELEEANPDVELVGEFSYMKSPTLFRCKIDGTEWTAPPLNVVSGASVCPQCKETLGEKKVRIWLEKHNIPYEQQKALPGCRHIHALRFDFYLPELNAVVEYDGAQHYKPIEFFGGEEVFKSTIERDKVKNDYCINNNIRMLRIPYSEDINIALNNFIYSA